MISDQTTSPLRHPRFKSDRTGLFGRVPVDD
jgi:hypothetical protein